MFLYQIWIVLFFAESCIATFIATQQLAENPLICFFRGLNVFKCYDDAVKSNVKFYNFNYYTGTIEDISGNCPYPNMPIKIVTHGWGGSASRPWFQQMNEFFNKNGIYNVIAMDWSHNAGNLNYLQAAADTKCIGDALGEFILDNLVKKCNVNLQDIHLVGHSLGAHITGFAGKYVQSNFKNKYGISNPNKIYRITGLDPAGPYFWKCEAKYRLSQGDATIVDTIHTDEFKFGCIDAIGDFDFYVNGGRAPQPGCFLVRKKRGLTNLGISCSHSRATALYIESIISEGFVSRKCENEINYKLGKCNQNAVLIMGEHLNGSLTLSGTYHLQTGSQYPFAKYGAISFI